ncbi:ethanolamine ammonia-lyase reactivating factor EutA [Bacillus sp. Marseille-P3661]|uniref:ethanolamine ammonia-lyase reactivating factor EutA n=1 Tax=Bacillus sp. Marseille-P3661 TaxID=1936234 RepID=UPI002155712A|nr:ethanolamine ammonia-lyase reactivating factor EutA [Bacillus sp. Marseille-P3661]
MKKNKIVTVTQEDTRHQYYDTHHHHHHDHDHDDHDHHHNHSHDHHDHSHTHHNHSHDHHDHSHAHHNHSHDHHDHEHDDEDHDHHGHQYEHDEQVELNPYRNGLWLMDNIELTSVGIDIGSSGTQVIFSRLHLRRIGESLTSRYVVTSRESFYRSPVKLTPYLDEKHIDDQLLGQYIDEFYEQSGVDPEKIDTGAVILTGEAMRRENAKGIADVLSDKGGNFVCATAGHNMEALLAAYGSGAAKTSYEEKKKILNIDIGGGTTKLAIVENGKVLETAAIYIGGRLVVVDETNTVVRLDPGGRAIAEKVGLSIEIGDVITKDQLEVMTKWMANSIFYSIFENNPMSDTDSLYLTSRLTQLQNIDAIIFSGGVGEYVYEKEEQEFGDLGKLLGKGIREIINSADFPYPIDDAKECIRATVIGASEHSVQVSGNTIFITDFDLLPKRNLQVIHPDYQFTPEIDANEVSAAIRSHFERFDLVEGEKEIALAFSWIGVPAYERINNFVKGIINAIPSTIEQGKDIVIVLDGDIASTLGHILKDEYGLSNDVIVIDGVQLKDFDFIDIGKVLYPSGTVPVTIKSLLFEM